MLGELSVEGARDLEAIRREIERHKDTLVEKAEQFFEERHNRVQKEKGIQVVPVDRTQLENVLRLALSTTSVKVVTNFIKYQMGRESKVDKGWRNGNFGVDLISMIEEISSLPSDSRNAIYFVQQFLGYCSRAAVYFRAFASEEKAVGGRGKRGDSDEE